MTKDLLFVTIKKCIQKKGDIMNSEHVERGGLRFGEIHWNSSIAPWPFAQIRINQESIHFSCSFLALYRDEFNIGKPEIQKILTARNMFPLPFIKGIIIEHSNKKHPSFILFWSFKYSKLVNRLQAFGYEIDVSERKWMM